MDKKERIEVLKAMDTVVRHLNDESVIEPWLESGVPDGTETDEDYALYIDDDEFADIMDTFTFVMGLAAGREFRKEEARRGTFYCDGVISKCH